MAGQEKEAKQSERRGLCRLGRFGRHVLRSKAPGEANKIVLSVTVKVVGLPQSGTIQHAMKSERPDRVLASFWH